MKWTNWKYLARERHLQASDEAFWATYSDEKGVRYNVQRILDILKAKRKKRAEQLTKAALYG